MMKKIGITGSIGSGKSTVSEYLSAKGYTIVDADALVKEIYLEREYVDKMVEVFGDIRLAEDSTQLDKKKIFNLVFSDKTQLEKLDQTIHPFIEKKIMQSASEHQHEEMVFFDIPLLFEKGYEKMMDKVIAVYCEDDTRWSRASKRSNKTVAEIQSVDKMQMTQQEKKSKADYVLDNSTTLEHLHQQIENLLEEIK